MKNTSAVKAGNAPAPAAVSPGIVENLLSANRREQREVRNLLLCPEVRSELTPPELFRELKRLERLRRAEAILCAVQKSSAWDVLSLLKEFDVRLSAGEKSMLTMIGTLE